MTPTLEPGWRMRLRYVAPVLFAVVLTRALFFAEAYVAQWLLVTDHVKPHFTFDIWRQWDALIYLDLAEQGYAPDLAAGHATAFFPLFPLMTRFVTLFGLPTLISGLLVSLLSTVVACVYLRRLADLHGYDGTKVVLYLLLFPTGVFLAAPYTEALFLAGAIPAFYYAYRGRPWPAALFTAVAVGTRTVGLFVLLGVAFELARRAWPHPRRLITAVVAMVLASGPLWAYGWWLHVHRGSFFDFVHSQKEGWGREFVGFKQGLVATWNTWDGDSSANIIFTWRLEVVFAALSVMLLGWLLVKRFWGYAIYVAATLAIALGNSWYYSNPRLALAFFPFAFLLAALIGRHERAHTYLVMVMAGICSVGVVAFTRSAWFF